MSEPGAWVLELDGARCDGHGICFLRCPDRVGLDEWGFAIVAREPMTNLGAIRRARLAVSACPVGALSLVPAKVDARRPTTRETRAVRAPRDATTAPGGRR